MKRHAWVGKPGVTCSIFIAGCLFLATTVQAGTTYAWTNTTVGYWNNSGNWNPSSGTPGSAAGDTANLNQGIAGAYTNILNTGLANSLSALTIQNSSGRAWLIVTNVTLTVATLNIGNGGLLEIDSGGIVTNNYIYGFNWTGNKGVILINNNGALFNAGPVSIGGSSVTALVTSASSAGQGGTWNLNGQLLQMGAGGSFSVLTVNNVTVTNVGGTVYIGNGAGNACNGLTLSNGASLYCSAGLRDGYAYPPANNANNNFFNVGGLGAASYVSFSADLNVGSAGNNGNTMTITNATLWSGGNPTIGQGSSNNVVTVLAGGVWNQANNCTLNLGPNATSVSNGLVVNGGGVINGAAVNFSNANAYLSLGGASNYVNILNGGLFVMNGAVTLAGPGDAYNVGGIGSISVVTNGAIYIGNSDTGGNTMTVTNATLLSKSSSTIGNTSANNTAKVQAGGTWDLLGSTLTVGSGSATGNVAWVQHGGLLAANGLVTGAGAGNLITNSSGVYQFTAATPTITPGAGFGSIAIANGTVSFRGITTADVFCNQSGGSKPLDSATKMAWSGNNTFRLNNATNNAATQTYWFDTNQGATNFAGLEMVNGGTAYTNGSVTIGTNGWLTFSSTSATMWGAVTNYGTLTIIDSSVTFKTDLWLAEAGTLTWITNATTNAVTVLGTLHLPASMILNVPTNAVGSNAKLALFNAPNGISGSPSGWTVVPNNYRVAVSGNSVMLATKQSCTAIFFR